MFDSDKFGLNPNSNPHINPMADPKINPNVDPKINPMADPKINPRVDPTINPMMDIVKESRRESVSQRFDSPLNGKKTQIRGELPR